MSNYKRFITFYADFYKKGFLVFVAVFATIFINIMTNSLDIDIATSFHPLLIFTFTLHTLFSILLAVIVSGVLYFIFVWVFGSAIYIVQLGSNYIYNKFGLFVTMILSFIILIVGATLSLYFKYPSGLWLLGLGLELVGMVPFVYTISNKLRKNKAVPAYVG